MKGLYRLFLCLFFTGMTTGLLGGPALAAGECGTLLVSQDFTEALASVLTAETGITVIRAIPADYAPDVHTSFLKKRWKDFAGDAIRADAVITTAAAWPAEPLYAWGRRANIRLVHIDAVQPLDHSRAGLPLLGLPDGSGVAPFVWHSPGHAARMADIVAMDLGRLFPETREQIDQNLDEFKRALFRLRTKYEIAFGALERFELVSLTSDFTYLTDECGVSVVDFFLKPELKWQADDLDLLAKSLEENGVNGVICSWEPQERILSWIREHGAHVIILKRFKLIRTEPAAGQLLTYYASNLEALLQGLSE